MAHGARTLGCALGLRLRGPRPRGAQSGAVNVVWGPRRAAAPVVCTRAVGELGRVESSRVRTLPRQCMGAINTKGLFVMLHLAPRPDTPTDESLGN